jgi:hypothetical protein
MTSLLREERTWTRRLARPDAALLGLGALLLVTTIAKFTFRADAPLWLDEVWTGMIASQQTFASFVHQCYLDIGAPLGYLVAWLWAPVSGLSNPALRLPSALFASAVPLVALAPSRAIPYQTRLIWCGLLACWLPGFMFAAEARPYSLLLLLAAANTASFARLLRAPSVTTAMIWTAISSLLILTHYVAGALVACQGLAYLLVHRTRAVRTWPAALAFLPVAASLAAHAYVFLSFAQGGTVSAANPGLAGGADVLALLAGGRLASGVVLVWFALSLALSRLLRSAGPIVPDRDADETLWIVPTAALGAVALFFVATLWRPVLVDRYLTPMVPAVLLGLAMVAARLGRSWRLAPAVLLALEFGLAIGLLIGPMSTLRLFNWEVASTALMSTQPRSLVFLWDTPADTAGDPGAFSAVGGFFFRRAGRPVPVDPVFLKPGDDPNLILAAHGRKPGAAILWLFDEAVPGTAALIHRPGLEHFDPRWRCRDFGEGLQHVLACSRDWR